MIFSRGATREDLLNRETGTFMGCSIRGTVPSSHYSSLKQFVLSCVPEMVRFIGWRSSSGLLGDGARAGETRVALLGGG
jgi:hypothetical protein